MNYTEEQIKILSIASNLKRIAQLVIDNKSHINDALILTFNEQSLKLFNDLQSLKENEDIKSLGKLLYQIKYGFPVNSYENAEKSLAIYNILINRIGLYLL